MPSRTLHAPDTLVEVPAITADSWTETELPINADDRTDKEATPVAWFTESDLPQNVSSSTEN
jgi:hypothetical protein